MTVLILGNRFFPRPKVERWPSDIVSTVDPRCNPGDRWAFCQKYICLADYSPMIVTHSQSALASTLKFITKKTDSWPTGRSVKNSTGYILSDILSDRVISEAACEAARTVYDKTALEDITVNLHCRCWSESVDIISGKLVLLTVL